jgi:hypothetical protein
VLGDAALRQLAICRGLQAVPLLGTAEDDAVLVGTEGLLSGCTCCEQAAGGVCVR